MERVNIVDQFKCSKCKKHLRPVIYQCNQSHMTCGECSDTKNQCPECEGQFVPVLRIVGTLAKSLLVPCAFQSNGCLKTFQWTEVKDHENMCQFRTYECPVTPNGGCNWRKFRFKLKEHFIQAHKGSSLISTDNSIKFGVDLSGPYHKVFLISMLNCSFLLHLIRKPEEDYTDVILQFVGEEAISQVYCFEIEIKKSNGKTTFKCEGLVNSDSIDITKTVKKVGIFDYNFVETNNNECILKIKETGQPTAPILDCPICMEKMKSPVFICSTGHSLCSNCRVKVTKCPSCRVTLGHARNYALESILGEPATVNENIAVGFYENDLFESNTDLTIHKCPFEDRLDCWWRGTLNEMLAHTKRDHRTLSMRNGEKGHRNDYNIIDVSGRPFVYSHVLSVNTLFVTVKSYDDSRWYKFTVDFDTGHSYIGNCSSIKVRLDLAVENGNIDRMVEDSVVVKVPGWVFKSNHWQSKVTVELRV